MYKEYEKEYILISLEYIPSHIPCIFSINGV